MPTPVPEDKIPARLRPVPADKLPKSEEAVPVGSLSDVFRSLGRSMKFNPAEAYRETQAASQGAGAGIVDMVKEAASAFPGLSKLVNQIPSDKVGKLLDPVLSRTAGAGATAMSPTQLIAGPLSIADRGVRSAGAVLEAEAKGISLTPEQKRELGWYALNNRPTALIGSLPTAPDTASVGLNTALRLGEDIARNPIATAGTGAIAGKLSVPSQVGLRPVVRLSAEERALAKSAEAQGIPLTPAEITSSRGLARAEVALDQTTLGGMVMREANLATKAAIDARRGAFLEETPTPSKAQGGQMIQSAIAEKSQAANERAGELFKRRDELAPVSDVPVTNLSKVAQEIAQEQRAAMPSQRDMALNSLLVDLARSLEQENLGVTMASRATATGGAGSVPRFKVSDLPPDVAKQIMAQLGPEAPQPLSWQRLNRLRTDLGKRITESDQAYRLQAPGVKGLSSPEAGAYKRLKKALDDDLKVYAEEFGGEFLAADELARNEYKTFKEIYSNPDVIRALKADPEKLVDTVFQANNVVELNRLKQAIGSEAFDATVKPLALEKILTESLASGEFSPAQFSKNLRRYNRDVLDTTLGKELTTELFEFAEVAQRARAAERIAGNPSGTTTTAVRLTEAGLLFTKPQILFAPWVIAKIYLSPVGRKLLLEGLKTDVSSPRGAQIAKELAGVAQGLQQEAISSETMPAIEE